jgi:hypothetical protein
VSLAGVIVPLARLKAALDVDELSLRQELAVISARRSRATQGWYSVRSALPPPRYSFVAMVKVVKFAVCPTTGLRISAPNRRDTRCGRVAERQTRRP